MVISSVVTEPKLALLAARQANKSGDDFLGQRTLIEKLADREDGRREFQKTIFPQSEFRLLLSRGREGEGAAVMLTSG